jgi:hypothetical protein
MGELVAQGLLAPVGGDREHVENDVERPEESERETKNPA